MCWRWQKNKSLQEERKFVPNENPLGYCFAHSAYRSLRRFSRIMVREPTLDPATTPLSVYWIPEVQQAKLLTAGNIETYMRQLACDAYDLHPRQDQEHLSKWSSHSLRVGACVLLHAMGFAPLDIQWILRWKSTAFMVYLRNVAVLSTRQNKAFDKAAALPNYV